MKKTLLTLAAPWLLHATQYQPFTLTHLTCGILILLASVGLIINETVVMYEASKLKEKLPAEKNLDDDQCPQLMGE